MEEFDGRQFALVALQGNEQRVEEMLPQCLLHKDCLKYISRAVIGASMREKKGVVALILNAVGDANICGTASETVDACVEAVQYHIQMW